LGMNKAAINAINPAGFEIVIFVLIRGYCCAETKLIIFITFLK